MFVRTEERGPGTVSATRKRATIADVAAAAGVSRGTVSLALNGKGRMASATREKIQHVAAELKYRPSLRGRRLRGGASESVALMTALPDAVVGRESHLNFLLAIALPLSKVLLERGYSTLLLPPVTDPSEDLANLDVDGAIVIDPMNDDQLCRELEDHGAQLVTIGRADGVAAHGVVDRGYGGADLSLRHLLEQGARRILILQTAERYSVARATERFLQEQLQAENIGGQVVHIPVAEGASGGYAATYQALRSDSPPDAVYAPIDAFAMGAAQAVREAGLRIPLDVMVCTNFDGPRAVTSQPPLTALDLQLPQLAEIAGELLLGCLDSPGGPPRVVQAPTAALRRRESTARHTGEASP